MTFLPKTQRSINELKSFAFGAPIALFGTAIMLFLIDLNGRLAGAG